MSRWRRRGGHRRLEGRARLDLNPTPLTSRSPTVSIRCGNDRPSRSNRQRVPRPSADRTMPPTADGRSEYHWRCPTRSADTPVSYSASATPCRHSDVHVSLGCWSVALTFSDALLRVGHRLPMIIAEAVGVTACALSAPRGDAAGGRSAWLSPSAYREPLGHLVPRFGWLAESYIVRFSSLRSRREA